MCLQYRVKKKDKKKWLENQPDTITAYKSVTVETEYWKINGKKRLFPSVYTNIRTEHFQRVNFLRRVRSEKSNKWVDTFILPSVKGKGKGKRTGRASRTKYVAYFHLYLKKEDAEKWIGPVIECQVPKKYITEVGEQNGKVIVTRKFTIVGQDKYLD